MADNVILRDSFGNAPSPINLIDQETELSKGAKKKPIPKLDPTLDYTQNAEGLSFMDLRNDREFQKDLVRFFNGGRYQYTKKEITKLGPKGLALQFAEHMRFQDTNEATAIKDLFYAKDNRNNTADELAAFGRLMSAWDGSEKAGTGFLTGVGDYAAGIASAPSTWASLAAIPATLGAGAIVGQLAKHSAKKGTQLLLRKTLAELIAKKSSAQILKKGVTATTLKGAGTAAVVEGGLGYGQIETQESTREQVIEDYTGMTPGQKALAVGFQSAFGGTIGGFGTWMNVKSANSAIDTLYAQQQKIEKQATAGAKNAVNTLRNKLTNPAANKKLTNVLSRIVAMTDTLEERALPRDSKNPLAPKSVKEGNKILNEIFSEHPNTNIIGGLSSKTLQGITAAASDIVDKLEIGPNERISSSIARALSKDPSESGSISTKEITDILDSYAITREEFSNVYLAELSEAGKTLGQAGFISRMTGAGRASKEEVEKVLTDMTALGKVGVSTIDDIMAREAVDLSSKSDIGLKLYKGAQELDAARIAYMTSQFATTARNVGFSVGRLGVDAADEVFKSLLTGTARVFGADIPKSPARGVFSMLRGMSSSKDMATVARVMLEEDMPAVYKKLFRDTQRVEVATGSNTLLARSATFVNTLNSATDHVFKQAAFYASLDRQLGATGTTFRDFAQSGKTFVDLDPDILERAGRDALDFTFQKGYEDADTAFGKSAKFVINLNRKLPFIVSGAGGMPFPRYVANHMEFIFDYMPVLGGAKGIAEGFAKKVHGPEFRFSKDKGQIERWSKQLTGTMMLTGAYYARSTQEGETDFSDFKTSEDGNIFKLGPMLGAAAGHFLIADLLYRYNNDLPLPLTEKGLPSVRFYKDAGEVLAGMSGLGFNTGMIEAIGESLSKGVVTDNLKRKLADVTATFSYPLTMAKDFLGQYDPEKSYTRYNPDMQGDQNLLNDLQTWGEFNSRVKKNIPDYDFLSESKSINNSTTLPRYSPFNSRPIGTINPAMKQIIGIDSRNQSDIQKEMSRLMIKEFDLYKNSTVKNPVVKYATEQRLSKYLGEEFERWRSTPQVKYDGKTYDDLKNDSNYQRDQFSLFVADRIRSVAQETEKRWQEYSKFAPTSAVGYIRNMYMIEGKEDIGGKPRYDVAAQSLPNSTYKTAEEFLSEATSLVDEINRRQRLMKAADLASSQSKIPPKN